jgi:hypothetical protein
MSLVEAGRTETQRVQGTNVEALRIALAACRVRLRTAMRETRNERRRGTGR